MDNRLVMRNISKRFGGVTALNNVEFEAEGGQVHALMGENGAGKSTLMKILAGAQRPDSGEIFLDGKRLELKDPHDARKQGISIIYQEFSLAKHLTVAENIFLDDLGNGSFVVNRTALKVRARQQLEKLGFGSIDVGAPVSALSIAEQQIVEISKALYRDSRVLVFDEPTAVLTQRETRRLFELIVKLKGDGVCIIYISHRLEEIFSICDFVTVLKDGSFVTTISVKNVTEASMANLMVGRELGELFPRRRIKYGGEVLRVENLSTSDLVKNVSFSVREGEVLGFSGLVGSGRTQTMRAIFGADRRLTGRIFLGGKEVRNRSPRESALGGLGMLPEDRKQQGVLLDSSIRSNAMLTPKNRFARYGWQLRSNVEKQECARLVRALRVKCRGTEVPVSSLSGGNQQKVALMKWISQNNKVLILDEPTRGVDVAAKIEIYELINELAQQGLGIVVVSSDMTEIIGICDRVIVMRLGRVAGELVGDAITEQSLIALSMGVK